MLRAVGNFPSFSPVTPRHEFLGAVERVRGKLPLEFRKGFASQHHIDKFDTAKKQHGFAMPERPAGVPATEKTEFGIIDMYSQQGVPPKGIAFFAHGVRSTRHREAPTQHMPDHTYYDLHRSMTSQDKQRPAYSRGDEALLAGFDAATISFKGDGKGAITPDNETLAHTVETAVESFFQSSPPDTPYILAGKSRGARAVLGGAARLVEKGRKPDGIILEAPVLSADRTTHHMAMKIKKSLDPENWNPTLKHIAHVFSPLVSHTVSAARSVTPNHIERKLESYLEAKSHPSRNYSLAEGLDTLGSQLNTLEPGHDLPIHVYKTESDGVAGTADDNAQIKSLFHSKGRVVEANIFSEDGEQLAHRKAADGMYFSEDGEQHPLETGRNHLLVTYNEIADSFAHGVDRVGYHFNGIGQS
jgi:hypothetical protein